MSPRTDDLVYAATEVASRQSLWKSGTLRLPPDLVAQATRRLLFVCLLYVLTFVFAYLSVAIVDPGFVFPEGRQPLGVYAGFLTIVLALALARATRSGSVPVETLIRLGLMFQVAGALAISLAESTAPVPHRVPIRGISWVTFWITMFPLLVPCKPMRALKYAMWSAAMGPIGYVAALYINDNPPLPTGHVVLFFLGNFTAALWAAIASRVMYDLGRSVREARRMGSYTLESRLGEGGMGEVWKATHRRLIRPAAVKLIRPSELRPAELYTLERRFEREAQATSMLESPHTVVLYDFGRTDEGVFYYAMELLAGISLEQLIEDEGPLPPARVAWLLPQICHSLEDAHGHGLIHRDIKPANILVCNRGGDADFIKVLDWGLVKTDRVIADEGKLTMEGTASGTPAYMPPEMVTGEGEIDRRADLYCVGCVAYWLLTGHTPFTADTTVRLLFKHAYEKPVPPSERVEWEIPDDLEAVVLSCLEKDPASRPRSAAALADLVRDLPSYGDWHAGHARKWWTSRHPGRTPARSISAPPMG